MADDESQHCGDTPLPADRYLTDREDSGRERLAKALHNDPAFRGAVQALTYVPESMLRPIARAAADVARRDVAAWLVAEASTAERAWVLGENASQYASVLRGLMGTGVNAQYRARHLVHVDPTWKPSEMDQRDGRIIRQGNANHSVEITRVLTEQSFDTFSYQTVTRKARAFGAFLSADLDMDEIEVPDDTLALHTYAHPGCEDSTVGHLSRWVLDLNGDGGRHPT